MLRSRFRGRTPRKRRWDRTSLRRACGAIPERGKSERKKTRIVGQRVLVTFAATGKSDPLFLFLSAYSSFLAALIIVWICKWLSILLYEIVLFIFF